MTALVSLFLALATALQGPPAWLTLAPGSQAYLKDDGRGVNGTTVCLTAHAYFRFENGGPPTKLCRVLGHGRFVRVLRIAGSNDQDGTVTPLVEIGTEQGAVGITDATFLRPIVPIGTILEARDFGDYPAQMWPTPLASKDGDYPGYGQNADVFGFAPIWTPLPNGTLARVLAQIPYGREADLNVVLLSGLLRGKSGWTLDLFVPHTDLASDEFAFSTTAGASGTDSTRE